MAAIRIQRTRLGGADRDRTGDPLLAKQVLSQLSYSPTYRMVGLGRVELPTSPLSGVRSNQLSYRPVLERCHLLPGGAHICLIRRLKGFEDWLNVRESYALADHRAMVDQAKKARFRIPAPAVRNGACGLDNTCTRHGRFASGVVRCRGRMQMPSLLF